VGRDCGGGIVGEGGCWGRVTSAGLVRSGQFPINPVRRDVCARCCHDEKLAIEQHGVQRAQPQRVVVLPSTLALSANTTHLHATVWMQTPFDDVLQDCDSMSNIAKVGVAALCASEDRLTSPAIRLTPPRPTWYLRRHYSGNNKS